MKIDADHGHAAREEEELRDDLGRLAVHAAAEREGVEEQAVEHEHRGDDDVAEPGAEVARELAPGDEQDGVHALDLVCVSCMKIDFELRRRAVDAQHVDVGGDQRAHDRGPQLGRRLHAQLRGAVGRLDDVDAAHAVDGRRAPPWPCPPRRRPRPRRERPSRLRQLGLGALRDQLALVDDEQPIAGLRDLGRMWLDRRTVCSPRRLRMSLRISRSAPGRARRSARRG